jgi:sec-independent protein translocase protein TatA
MGSLSIWHWVIVLAVGLLLFGGRGKISELMGDFAKGIKSFKKGLSEDDKPEAEAAKTEPMKTIDHQAAPSTATGAPTASNATSGAPAESRKVG